MSTWQKNSPIANLTESDSSFACIKLKDESVGKYNVRKLVFKIEFVNAEPLTLKNAYDYLLNVLRHDTSLENVFKFGTKICFEDRGSCLHIEFRPLADLSGNLVLRRLARLSQSNAKLLLGDVTIHFTCLGSRK